MDNPQTVMCQMCLVSTVVFICYVSAVDASLISFFHLTKMRAILHIIRPFNKKISAIKFYVYILRLARGQIQIEYRENFFVHRNLFPALPLRHECIQSMILFLRNTLIVIHL